MEPTVRKRKGPQEGHCFRFITDVVGPALVCIRWSGLQNLKMKLKNVFLYVVKRNYKDLVPLLFWPDPISTHNCIILVINSKYYLKILKHFGNIQTFSLWSKILRYFSLGICRIFWSLYQVKSDPMKKSSDPYSLPLLLRFHQKFTKKNH